MPDLYYPRADHTTQDFSGSHPGSTMSRIDKLVVHTTEGVSWPDYSSGGSSAGAVAPTFTIMPDFATKTVHVRQHFPVNMSARALQHPPGTAATNTDNAVQVELVGTDGWATTRNPHRDYTLAEQWYWPDAPDWMLQGLADLIAWLHTEHGLQITAPATFVPWSTDNRLSEATWHAARGILGHQHVPSNDHSDPGQIPIVRIMQLAKGSAVARTMTTATVTSSITPTPITEDLDMTKDELVATLYAVVPNIIDQHNADLIAGKRGMAALHNAAAIAWNAGFALKAGAKGVKATDWTMAMETIRGIVRDEVAKAVKR